MAAAASTSVIPATTTNSLEYMSSVFEKEGELPVLDVGQRALESITAADMPFFLMKGVLSTTGRTFFVLKHESRVQKLIHDNLGEWWLYNPSSAPISVINEGGQIKAAAMQQIQTYVTGLISLDTQYRISLTATVLTTVEEMPLEVQKIVFSYIGTVRDLARLIRKADGIADTYETERAQELSTAEVVASDQPDPMDARPRKK